MAERTHVPRHPCIHTLHWFECSLSAEALTIATIRPCSVLINDEITLYYNLSHLMCWVERYAVCIAEMKITGWTAEPLLKSDCQFAEQKSPGCLKIPTLVNCCKKCQPLDQRDALNSLTWSLLWLSLFVYWRNDLHKSLSAIEKQLQNQSASFSYWYIF